MYLGKNHSDYITSTVLIIYTLKISVLCVLICPVLVLSQPTSRHKYSPRIQTEGKIGNRRSIVRPSTLLPLYQRSDSLLYLSLIGMSDTRNALEANIGIGTRYLLGQNIIGIYGFYDIRKSSMDNVIHQGTFGLEWFREYLEFRFNIYLPQTKKYSISEVENISHYRKSGNTVNIGLGTHREVEQALRGFDIDIGAQPRSLPNLTGRVAYYWFGSPENYIKNRIGYRGVLGYKIHENIDLDFEVSYDNQRNWVYFGGITISYDFDKSNRDIRSLTRLERKMTLLPIRDIDIVGSTGGYDDNGDGLEINGITSDTNVKILIANFIDNTLREIEIENGELKLEKVTDLNVQDPTISSIIADHLDKDIIEDPNVWVYMIRKEGNSNVFVDLNEVDYQALGYKVSTTSHVKKLLEDDEKFLNFANLLNPGLPNIGRVKKLIQDNSDLQDEIERLQQLSQQAIEELERARQESVNERQQLEETALETQTQLESELRRVRNTLNSRSQELEERLRILRENAIIERNQLTQEALLRQQELENELTTLRRNSNLKQLDLQKQMQKLQEETKLKLFQSQKLLELEKQKFINMQNALEERYLNSKRLALASENDLKSQLQLVKREFAKQKNELLEKIKLGSNNALIQRKQFEQKLLIQQNESNEVIRKLKDEHLQSMQKALEQQKLLEEKSQLTEHESQEKLKKLQEQFEQKLLIQQNQSNEVMRKLKDEHLQSMQKALEQQKLLEEKSQLTEHESQEKLKKLQEQYSQKLLMQQNQSKEVMRKLKDEHLQSMQKALEQQKLLEEKSRLTEYESQEKLKKLQEQYSQTLLKQKNQSSEVVRKLKDEHLQSMQKALEQQEILEKRLETSKIKAHEKLQQLQTKLSQNSFTWSQTKFELEQQLKQEKEKALLTEKQLKEKLFNAQQYSKKMQNEYKQNLLFEQQRAKQQHSKYEQQINLLKEKTYIREQTLSEKISQLRQSELSYKQQLQEQSKYLIQVEQGKLTAQQKHQSVLQTLNKQNMTISDLRKTITTLEKQIELLQKGRISKYLKEIQQESNHRQITKERRHNRHRKKLQSRISKLETEKQIIQHKLYESEVSESSDDEFSRKRRSKKQKFRKKRNKQESLEQNHTFGTQLHQKRISSKHNLKISLPKLDNEELSLILEDEIVNRQSKPQLKTKKFTFDEESSEEEMLPTLTLTPVNSLTPMTPSQRLNQSLKLSKLQLSHSQTMGELDLKDIESIHEQEN
jgi:hypothetical protein